MDSPDRKTVRLPAEFAQEMHEASKRTGISVAYMVGCGWKAVRDHFMSLPPAPTIDVDAIYKSKRK